jgi:hypothetical protein
MKREYDFAKGERFLTDEAGRKTAAVIDFKKHRALWEDIADVLVSRSRRQEKRIPLAKMSADVVKNEGQDSLRSPGKFPPAR